MLASASALVIALFLAADCAVLDNILMCRKKQPKDEYTEANQRFAAAAAVLCLWASGSREPEPISRKRCRQSKR